MTTDVDFLAQVPLFSRLKREELMGLAGCLQHHTFSAGEEIITEGDTDRRLFVIVRGMVEVIKGRGHRTERHLSTFGPRDYFGEMAIIDDLVRSATVVAKETTELLSLDQWSLRTEIESNPAVAIELLRVLSQRVRALEKIVMNSLGGLLPICLNCKNIRDESGSWVRIEEYITDRSEADFTHGVCPECLKKLSPKHFK
jgi:CRP/FNR family cyclic AMP-dependent transcriptional regulator